MLAIRCLKPAAGGNADRFCAKAGSFADIDHLLGRDHLAGYDGFAMDLGVSSPHFDRPERGFSFREPGPLDMRFDRTSGQPLSRLLEDLDEERLRRILKEYGEERYARRIARAILRARDGERLTDTVALAITIREAYPAYARYDSPIDPATRSFQALRIFVNDELREIRTALMKTLNAMRPGARLAVISFHSLEDRMVKRLFRAVSEGERDFFGHRMPAGARDLTRKPITPAPVEAAINPRARSAKMRVIEKLDAGQIVKDGDGAIQ